MSRPLPVLPDATGGLSIPLGILPTGELQHWNSRAGVLVVVGEAPGRLNALARVLMEWTARGFTAFLVDDRSRRLAGFAAWPGIEYVPYPEQAREFAHHLLERANERLENGAVGTPTLLMISAYDEVVSYLDEDETTELAELINALSSCGPELGLTLALSVGAENGSLRCRRGDVAAVLRFLPSAHESRAAVLVQNPALQANTIQPLEVEMPTRNSPETWSSWLLTAAELADSGQRRQGIQP